MRKQQPTYSHRRKRKGKTRILQEGEEEEEEGETFCFPAKSRARSLLSRIYMCVCVYNKGCRNINTTYSVYTHAQYPSVCQYIYFNTIYRRAERRRGTEWERESEEAKVLRKSLEFSLKYLLS